MNREVFAVGVCIIMAATIVCYFGVQARDKKLQSIKQSILSVHRPRIIHFYSDYCGPCKTFEPILRQSLQAYGGSIDCVDINVAQKSKNGYSLGTFGTSAIPTCVFFDREGNKVDQLTGCVDAKTLEMYLRKMVN